MSWWKPHRSHRRQDPVPSEGDVGAWVCSEASALLLGRSADLFDQRGQFVPWWAWLNAAAHREAAELEQLAGLVDQPQATDGDQTGPAQGPLAAAVIAAALLKRSGGDEATVFRLQHECLIPLVLELMSGRLAVDDPGRLLHLALVALHTGRCPNSG